MTTDPTLRNPVRAYIDLRRGLLSNLQLIVLAQDFLSDPGAPTWVAELANLRTPDEKRTARQLFERRLTESGLLPDSRELRVQLQLATIELADRIVELSNLDVSPLVDMVVELLHLCPGYQASNLSSPIEEIRHQPTKGETALELSDYIKRHIKEILPLESPK